MYLLFCKEGMCCVEDDLVNRLHWLVIWDPGWGKLYSGSIELRWGLLFDLEAEFSWDLSGDEYDDSGS